MKATPSQLAIIDDWYSGKPNDKIFLSTMEDLGVKSKSGEIKVEDLNRFSKDVLDVDIANAKATLPKSPDTSLISQAKKMSKEEFIKAQGTPVYHGTDSEFETFLKNKQANNNSGFYFTESKSRATKPLIGAGVGSSQE